MEHRPEVIVGKALRGRRDDVVLATKFFMPFADDPNHRGGSRRWIMTEVEHSLRRLGTDRIDAIVPPGITLNPADNGWVSPSLQPSARRRGGTTA